MATNGKNNNNNLTLSGRKVYGDIENPVDNVLIKISDILAPTFRSMGFTPNGLTTISLILGTASLYHLNSHDLTEFSIYASLSYLFDVMDGYYARKYNMETMVGDKYDHYKDLILVLAGFFIVYKQYGDSLQNHPILIISALTLMVLGLINTGCQEKIKNDNTSGQEEILRVLDPLVPQKENCSYHMSYLKYFGIGTLVLLGICAIWYLDHSDKQRSLYPSNVIDIYNFPDTSDRSIGYNYNQNWNQHQNKWSMGNFMDSLNGYFYTSS
jgi:hypothetical protein